jgi:hypothetical protein
LSKAGWNHGLVRAIEDAKVEILGQPEAAVAFGGDLDRDAGIADQKGADLSGQPA